MRMIMAIAILLCLLACSGADGQAQREVADVLHQVARDQGVELPQRDLECLSQAYVSVLGRERVVPYLKNEYRFSDFVEQVGTEGAMAIQQDLQASLLACAQPRPMGGQ